MSFDFGNNNINPIKTQATYKDGGGMGGGGMYMKQNKKRKDQPEEDLFEFGKDHNSNEINFDTELLEEEIPRDNMFNQFVNWFRKKNS